jgi:23S rRNA (adenine1618-N6)-methyltransferase
LILTITDIDSKSLEYARKNVQLNDLESQIRVLSRTVDDSMIPLDESPTIDFTMSNPPFYESKEDLVSSAKGKSRKPFTACTGSATEMVVEGGEMAFIGRILDESLVHRDKIQWYTSMFGKQSSCEAFIEKLHDKGITNFAVTEFVQGTKTRRWAVGWSFGEMRPSTEAARGVGGDKWKKILPPIVDVPIISLQVSVGVGKVESKIHEMMASLELISWDWNKELLRGIGRARENVWSRAWRRRKAREGATASAPAETDLCAFGFEVLVIVTRASMDVSCRWREGHDAVIFESFTGFLKTQLKSIV